MSIEPGDSYAERVEQPDGPRHVDYSLSLLPSDDGKAFVPEDVDVDPNVDPKYLQAILDTGLPVIPDGVPPAQGKAWGEDLEATFDSRLVELGMQLKF